PNSKGVIVGVYCIIFGLCKYLHPSPIRKNNYFRSSGIRRTSSLTRSSLSNQQPLSSVPPSNPSTQLPPHPPNLKCRIPNPAPSSAIRQLHVLLPRSRRLQPLRRLHHPRRLVDAIRPRISHRLRRSGLYRSRVRA